MRRVYLMAAIALILGSCSASPPVVTTSPPPLVDLELSGDGLGDVALGVDPETVVTDISALFGGPDDDSGWVLAEPNIYGSCPGAIMRAISWGSLVTIFVDDLENDLGGWFFTYTYGYDYAQNTGGIDTRGLGLTTREGIGIGSPVSDLRVAFGAGLTINGDSDLDVWSFTTNGIRGLLTGPEDGDTVTLIEAEVGCE